jgi:hypothetical protein
MENLDLTEEEADGTVDYLIKYFKLSFSEQRSLVLEWKQYAKNLSLEMLRGVLTSSCTKQVFLLPGSCSHRVCHNAIAKLTGKSKFAWSSIGEEGKELHGLANKKGNKSMSKEVDDKLNEYFFSLSSLGQPRATKIVRNLTADKNQVVTELKDADADPIELPACHTKRALYRSFLLKNGWTATFDNKSRMARTMPRQFLGQHSVLIGGSTIPSLSSSHQVRICATIVSFLPTNTSIHPRRKMPMVRLSVMQRKILWYQPPSMWKWQGPSVISLSPRKLKLGTTLKSNGLSASGRTLLSPTLLRTSFLPDTP